MWEVTGRGCVCSAWGCEICGGEGVRWPSFQATSYVPPTFPRLQEETLLPQPQTLSLSIPPSTPFPQAIPEVSCLSEANPCENRQYPHIVKGLGLAGAPHGP